jgi:hypothetical protein
MIVLMKMVAIDAAAESEQTVLNMLEVMSAQK